MLRRRTAAELALLFRESYVCIRRFRSADGRLLPLVLDPPRLLKHKAAPSALALQLGLARPMPPELSAGASPAVPAGATGADEPPPDEPPPAAAPSDGTPSCNEAALPTALRLFSLYVAAGGALCQRPAVWRKLMNTLHPDRGGDVAAFQHVSALKRRIDSGEVVQLPPSVELAAQAATAALLTEQGEGSGEAVTPILSAAEEVYSRVRAELVEAARLIGGPALKAVEGL